MLWVLVSCASEPTPGLEPTPDPVEVGPDVPVDPAAPPSPPAVPGPAVPGSSVPAPAVPGSPAAPGRVRTARPPRPAPEAKPAPALPDPDRQVVIRVDQGLDGVRGGTLECGSQKLKADRSHDTIVFDDVPAGSCRLTFKGDDLSGVVLAGTWWHLERRATSTVLVRE